jgi:CRP-like cAMP-binding protein
MGHAHISIRLLPDDKPLRNQLLCAIPLNLYRTVAGDIRMVEVAVGDVVHDDGEAMRDVHFPNGGVYSVTNQMSDGRLVEVATVGTEGMLGVNAFLGDRVCTGRTLLQVPGGPLPAMAVDRFSKHTSSPGPFRDIIERYALAFLQQIMQCTACNALHGVEARCSRWLLQTRDRVGQDEFTLKHEFLAVMLGVSRPTVTVVMGTLQKAGLVSYHYGRVRVLDRERLEATSCECYEAIRRHFERLGNGDGTNCTP